MFILFDVLSNKSSFSISKLTLIVYASLSISDFQHQRGEWARE